MNCTRSPADLTARRAAEALRWWIEAGVDIALDETPHDRFAESGARRLRRAVAAPAAVAPPARASAAAAVAPPDEAARSAAEAARAARTLDELRAALDGFRGCGLKATATQLVLAAIG